MGVFKYQGQKSQSKRSPTATIALAEGANGSKEWNSGFVLANTQNWSRTLMDTPANLMTPTIFAQNVKDRLVPLGVNVEAHNREWAEQQGMGSYLSVANGSAEPPVFLEITYTGSPGDQKPICLVGKGITFDSGGISLKPSSKMDEMRADMGGAAVVAGKLISSKVLNILKWQRGSNDLFYRNHCCISRAESAGQCERTDSTHREHAQRHSH